jgi:hypothetical protein
VPPTTCSQNGRPSTPPRTRFGFEPFGADDPANFDLYLLTKDIAATLANL